MNQIFTFYNAYGQDFAGNGIKTGNPIIDGGSVKIKKTVSSIPDAAGNLITESHQSTVTVGVKETTVWHFESFGSSGQYETHDASFFEDGYEKKLDSDVVGFE